MPLTRPTLTELKERGSDDINARLPGADSRLRRSVLSTLATVHAGATHGLYGALEWLSRQILPDTAEAAELQRWSTIWGVNRKPAAKAEGGATATGVNGSEIPAGARLMRADGIEYEATVDATIDAGEALVEVRAIAAGAAGLASSGIKLAFVSPIAGVNASATVAAPGLTGGEDEESDDNLRARLLERIRRAPSGGSRSDYERWAREVAGVTRAWVYPGHAGPGTVGVTFMMDGRPDPIPLEADVDAVAAWLDTRRPVTAEVVTFAPTAVELNPEIHVTPDTSAVRSAIYVELRDFLRRDASPGGVVYLSRLREAISSAAGESFHALVSPAADVVLDANEIAVLGTIDWGGA